LLMARTPGQYAIAFARQIMPKPMGEVGLDPVGSLQRNPESAVAMGCALLRGRIASPAALRDAAATVARSKIPTLVITAGFSPFFDAVGTVTARLTGGRHVLVPAPNHFPQFVNPDEFNQVVDGFMKSAG